MRAKYLLVAGSLLVLAACTPNRDDLPGIQSNYDAVHEGDFGALLHHMYQAEEKSEYALGVKENAESHPEWMFTRERSAAVSAAEEAVEHRKEAEAALNRFLDPLRARIAYLESLHVPEGTGAISQSIYFDTGSAAVRQEEVGKIEEVANFLAEYPISAVTIVGMTDTVGSEGANKDLSRRRAAAVVETLRDFGVPLASTVAVSAAGEAEGPDETDEQENRSVVISVSPHGRHVGG